MSALYVSTKRSLIRAGVTQGGSGETLQSAGNSDTANTVATLRVTGLDCLMTEGYQARSVKLLSSVLFYRSNLLIELTLPIPAPGLN